MITQNQYMLNSSKLHHTFYLQFVNEACLKRVTEKIGVERLKASQDIYFNDIPLDEWDCLGLDAEQLKLMKKCGSGYSLASAVCVNKAAARFLIKRAL